MNDKLNEELSAFMDDEAPEARRLAERLSRDPELQARWSRYHLIRDAMTEHLTYAEFDIAARVSQALENEPTVLAPRRWHLPPRARKVARQVAGLAIAATVSAVTVMTVQQQRVEHSAPAAVAQAASGSARVATATPGRPPARVVQFVPENRPLKPEVRSKLSNYLVNHNEYSVTSNMQGMLPYMRIVSAHSGESAPAAQASARIENAVVNGQ